ncbi:MAG: hypothetical protein GX804_01170 [Lentisphaerae bacterium]|jgi:hypothetical protein|nr:hypothetical protein [Lentisphaerota bacterium]
MKNVKKHIIALALLCIYAAFSFNNVFAQAAASQSSSQVLRIKNITKLGRDTLQRAPTIGSRSPRAKDWGVIDVEFDTAAEWLDEVSVTFTVMTFNPKVNVRDGEKPMSLFSTTSSFKNISAGRGHKAGVVLLPSTLERYGPVVGIGVQFYLGGQIIAEEGIGDASVFKDQAQRAAWWKISEITDSPNVQKREGFLLERTKTIFALVDPDSYEVSH